MKPRIAYIAPGFPPTLGGVERHVHELAMRASRAGWAVEVLTQDGTEDAVEVVGDVVVRRFANRSPAAAYPLAPALIRFVSRHGRSYELVHAQNYHALSSVAAASGRCSRLVFTPHYLGAGETSATKAMHRLYHPLGAAIFARAGRIICVTMAEAKQVQERFPHVRGRITVIPNGIDVDAIRRAEPMPTCSTVVLAAGRLEPYKNVELAVRALAHLPQETVLHVAGDGPGRPALEAAAISAGVAERVRFLGRLDARTLYRWYRTAAAYVSLSRRECFGLTLLEAAVAGAGVVAADTPVTREVLHGAGVKGASLLPADIDAAGVAAAVASQAARPRNSAHPCTWDDVASKTFALYEDILRLKATA